jgi:hypothetical protein
MSRGAPPAAAMRLKTMNESDAKAALRAMGIFAPSRSLAQNWLRANEAAESLDEAERRLVEAPSTQPNTAAEGRIGVAGTPISSPDLTAAIHALEAKGIPTTHQAVLDWLAQHRPVRAAPVTAEQQLRLPQTSQAEPLIPQKKGSSKLARFAVPPAEGRRKRKPGRPLTIASWFPAVAATMADGTTLRTALAINSLTLNANEMRALYRNKTFKGLYQEARRRYLIENWGRSGPSLRAILGRCL